MSEIPPISDMEICMSENPVYSSIRLVYGDSDEILHCRKVTWPLASGNPQPDRA
jgi:hypothetical protein